MRRPTHRCIPGYAEFCALSEIDKKPGFGAEIVPGGPGGHSVIYLNGACRVKDAGYPVVALLMTTAGPRSRAEGVGAQCSTTTIGTPTGSRRRAGISCFVATRPLARR